MSMDIMFDSTIPYDVRFFEALDRFVQSEPWLERDRGHDRSAQDHRDRKRETVQA